jgi:aminopeptidase-like protein
MMAQENIGENIYQLAKQLFPICRSITGNGVRKTLAILKHHVPDMQVFEIPSGTKCFDWEVPEEWNINDAFIKDECGKKIISFEDSNLHVVSYSTPIHKKISLEELQQHLHSLPDQPEAIPYVTSYYQKRWGFCLSDSQRKKLLPGEYEVCIDSSLEKGSLTYGELLLPGESRDEIFISTYVCHPSMANNELSGPCVVTFLAKWLSSLKNRRYSYRIIFIPETIGSITYLSRNIAEMKSKTVAGFNVSCIGDERCFSYLPSRHGNTLADRSAKLALSQIDHDFIKYTFLDRGSDERQYCSPGIDLPVASIMRSKYGTFPEYHTSLDDLSLVTPKGLEGGFLALQSAIKIIEGNYYPKIKMLCEPQLGKRGLYSNLSEKNNYNNNSLLMNILAYSDGKTSLIEMAEKFDVNFAAVESNCQKLLDHGLIEILSKPLNSHSSI